MHVGGGGGADAGSSGPDQPSKRQRVLLDAAAGAAAGCVSRVAVGPLDVIKIRFQVQLEPIGGGAGGPGGAGAGGAGAGGAGPVKPPPARIPGGGPVGSGAAALPPPPPPPPPPHHHHFTPKYRGLGHAFATILREEGVAGLWRGTVPGVLLAVPYTAVQFVALQQVRGAAARWLQQGREGAGGGSGGGSGGSGGGGGGGTASPSSTPARNRKAPEDNNSDSQAKLQAGFVAGAWGHRRRAADALPPPTPAAPSPAAPLRQEQQQPPAWVTPAISFASGALAGAAGTVASYPFDLLRTTLAAQGEPRVYAGMLDAARGIVARGGARALYRGLGVTLVEIVPYAALQFGLYDALNAAWADAAEKRAAHEADRAGGAGGAAARGGGGGGGGSTTTTSTSSSWSWYESDRLRYFACGLAAGLCAKLATHPLDVAKKRYQVAGLERSLAYGRRVDPSLPARSLAACLGDIWRREGARGLWKGSVPSVVKAAPAAAVTFVAYEAAAAALLEAATAHNAKKRREAEEAQAEAAGKETRAGGKGGGRRAARGGG
jgi:hypothetical protein